MPVSGPIVHQQLIQAYHEAQHELESARGQIAAAGAELGQLTEGKGDTLLKLARHCLPELTRQAVEASWSQGRDRVLEVLRRQETHSKRLASELEQLDRDRTAAEAELDAVNAGLDAANERQESLAQAVSDALSTDTQFADSTNRAAEAEASLQRAEANLDEIEQDARRKLPDYEQSTLFMYLYKRQFGTPHYRSRGYTRSIDQWLSRYIGYRDARQGYEFLRSTPQHMREVIAEDRRSLNTVLDELERRRDAVAQQLGLTATLAQIEQLSSQRSQLVDQLEQIEQQTQLLQNERLQIDDPRGPYYHQAIETFRDMLGKADPRVLAEQAKATPELEDDRIVARLQGLHAEMEQVSDHVRQRQQSVARLTAHLQAVGTLINRFRAAGFDSQRAQFNSSVDIDQQLRAAQAGQVDCEDLWQQLRQSHRWTATTMDRVTQVATHPMTQVLISAMAIAAAGALQAQARQAGQRRAAGRPRSNNRSGDGGRSRTRRGF